ncbi:MAG: hypothetical protein J0G30_11550 [Actinomycetales bacterium]|nr:hypothetical protein [Actinomycetales bacterium]
MSDLARFLPLSNRPRRDESGTSRDWAARVAEVAAAVEAVADRGDGPHPEAESALAAVRDLALTSAARHAAGRRVRVRELRAVLLAAWRASDALGAPLELDPVVTGAVALDLAAGARLPIRAVIRDRTLVASDAGWRLGGGEELVGTAREIVTFLAGEGPVPGA